MLFLYAFTLFLSAALLFFVEPMIGRMVLPLLGGTPAVWNTCLVFFQGALLLGYLYAHATTRWLGARRQAPLHLLVLLVPLLFLPIRIAADLAAPVDRVPVLWLLGVLTVAAGAPMLVIATSAPLLQRWFAGTSHPQARDPYLLYGASNLGSLLSLLAYPLLIEPRLSLRAQGRLWTAGYALLLLCVAGCVLLLRRHPAAAEVPAVPSSDPGDPGGRALDERPPTTLRRLRWIALSLFPSSLMLGVTSYLSTDIASIPLLWVAPLCLYLLTFILAFSRLPARIHQAALRLGPGLALAVLVVMFFAEVFFRFWPVVVIHLLCFFLLSLAAHGELARDRPAPRHLTEFYLWLSVGGVLGGLFNALLAPLCFRSVAEYPLALVGACLLLPRPQRPFLAWDRRRVLDFVLSGALGGLALLAIKGATRVQYLGDHSPRALYGVPLVLGFLFLEQSFRFRVAQIAVLCVSLFFDSAPLETLHQERSFFGVHLVLTEDGEDEAHRLLHGTTIHGRQYWEPERRRETVGYYHSKGPVGQIFGALHARVPRPQVAVVGLGAGTLAAYGQPGGAVTFYEIDPAVVRIASDCRYFTFLADSKARINVVLGDARLRLGQATPRTYDLMLVDAFSSDMIPVHLLTREAVQVYLRALGEQGLLAFHVSNRFFHLAPVLGDLARDAGLFSRWCDDEGDSKIEKYGTDWVVLARREADLAPFTGACWRALPTGKRLWTDDYSDVVGVLK